jgi:hypothetical protein
MKRILPLFIPFFCGTMTAQTTLQINELMQSNIDCYRDNLNDFPDSWVELYNPTTESIALKDYKLGTQEDAATAWQLPSQTVAPGAFVIVCCDKEATGLHTDFRLESGKGCNAYLFKGDAVVDKVTGLKKQPAPNISYGRLTEADSEWGYQYTPTPGKANCQQLCKNILGEPVFSQKGKVMKEGTTTELTLSLPEGTPEGAFICYTTNGSEPTAYSSRYEAPLTLTATTVVRAKLFCKGYLSPRATVHSYIMFPTNRELTLPVISISTDDAYLNDPKIGIYVTGTYNSKKNNYEYNWRRPMNIEFFEGADQHSVINQLGEMRIAGGASRSSKFKTLAVYAHKRFGTKRLNYEFFPDQKPGLKDFKSIMLRNAGNDFDYLYMRDAVIQRTMASHVDLDWQAWRPAIIYINGNYSGILNIRERSNEDNIYTNYDGLEDIDMVENWTELKEGSIDSFNEFKAFYAEQGHTLAEYAERMDWEEFINLMAMDLYYNNLDAPGNNLILWRPKAAGGKWRWVAKDTDFALGLYGDPYNYKVLEWLYNPNYDANHNWGANGYDGTRLFRRLMEDNDFKREFIDRTSIYMGDFLNEKGTREVWDPMYEIIKTEYPYHRELINRWWPNYAQELSNAQEWLRLRTAEFYKQLGDYYQLGAPIPLTINVGTAEQLKQLTVNGIQLSQPVFDGKFFAGRQLTISGQAIDGKEVKGWKLTGAIDEEQTGSTLSVAMPQGALFITPVVGEVNGISTVCRDITAGNGAVYDLTGCKIATPQKGRIYIRNGRKYIEN